MKTELNEWNQTNPAEQRKKEGNPLRLEQSGDVDAVETSKIWKALLVPLHDTAVQFILGCPGLTSQELASVPQCLGPVFFSNIQKLTNNQGWPFCMHGPESRYYLRHECSQSLPGFLHSFHVCCLSSGLTLPAACCVLSGIQQHDYGWCTSHIVDLGEPACWNWEFTAWPINRTQSLLPWLIVVRHSDIIRQVHWMNHFHRICTGCCDKRCPQSPRMALEWE